MPLDVPIICKGCAGSGEALIYDFGSDDEGNATSSETESSDDEDDDDDGEDSKVDPYEKWRELRERLEERRDSYHEKRRERMKLSDDDKINKQNRIIARLEDRDIRRVGRYARLKDRHTRQRTKLKRRIALRDERAEERDQRIAEHESNIHRLEDEARVHAVHDTRRITQIGLLAQITDLQKLRITTLEEQLAIRDGPITNTKQGERPRPLSLWGSSMSSSGSRDNPITVDGETTSTTQNTTPTSDLPAATATRVRSPRSPLLVGLRTLRKEQRASTTTRTSALGRGTGASG